MPKNPVRREVHKAKDWPPPVRHFGTIFFNDNDIYVGEYILGKRQVGERKHVLLCFLPQTGLLVPSVPGGSCMWGACFVLHSAISHILQCLTLKVPPTLFHYAQLMPILLAQRFIYLPGPVKSLMLE